MLPFVTMWSQSFVEATCSWLDRSVAASSVLWRLLVSRQCSAWESRKKTHHDRCGDSGKSQFESHVPSSAKEWVRTCNRDLRDVQRRRFADLPVVLKFLKFNRCPEIVLKSAIVLKFYLFGQTVLIWTVVMLSLWHCIYYVLYLVNRTLSVLLAYLLQFCLSMFITVP